MVRLFFYFLFVGSTYAQTQRIGKYEVTLRPPAGGLFAGEEMQIEFRVADASDPDPLMGAAPVIRADVRSVIAMPAMPGMSKIEEFAHPEGVPGDYGLHPTFAHGGEYTLRLEIRPPGGETFPVEYVLDVKDPDPARPRKAAIQPYRLELETRPKRIRTGEPVEFRLRVFAAVAKQALTAFDVNHERKLHLIVTQTKDFLPFAHLHPEMQPDGTFVVSHTFVAPGDYSVFADVAPKGAGAQVLYAKVSVTGNALPAAEQAAIRLDPVGPLKARKTQTVKLAVRDAQTGEPRTDLEPYLGAMGHLILVADGGATYVHSHPDERVPRAAQNGVIPFLVRPPKPGKYRGMVEVQRNGKVERAAFTVEAEL